MIALPCGNRGQTRRRTHRETPGAQRATLRYAISELFIEAHL
jgi:hypothetical protein